MKSSSSVERWSVNMAKVYGFCNLHDAPRLGKLTEKRPIGTVSFLGRYGLMDFTLSNFSTSGIDRVGILVDRSLHSVVSHVRDGSIWVNNTKTGGQRLFYNENNPSSKFNTDVNNLLANRLHFEDIDADYVVIAPSFFIMSIDYRKYIEKHIDSGNKISLIYKKVKNAKEQFLNCDVVKMDNHLVKNFSINMGTAKEAAISLETFIFDYKTFVELVNKTREISTLFNIRDLVNYCATNGVYNVNAFSFDGYVAPILTFDDFVKSSMDLLSYENRKELFKEDWPIYTTTHNTPPAQYGEKANVSNSFVSNGSRVKGTVINSILSRDVVVEEGAEVRDCILFSGTKVGKGSKLQYVVADKNVKIKEVRNVKGDEDHFLYISFGANI